MTTQITLRVKRSDDGFLATVIGPREEQPDGARLVQRFGLTQYEAASEALRELFEVEKESHLLWTADNGRPCFKHDCETCEYLGTILREGYKLGENSTTMDAYVCSQGGVYPTVVLRTGDDGPEYGSSAGMVDWLPAGLQTKAVDRIAEMKRTITSKGVSGA